MPPDRRHLGWGALLALLAVASADRSHAQERRDVFQDPFEQVTSALPGCPEPQPPAMTEQELRDAAHVRSQHGGSCYLSGRCRLPNSYLYDKEIIPRVVQYIRRDGRFDATSVWVLGERRIVTLMGCVQSREQAEALERAVALVDDVLNVVNQVMVGTDGQPPYPALAPSRRKE